MSAAIKKLSRRAIIGALLVVGLVGCGGSNPDASATPPATTSSLEQPAAERPASIAPKDEATDTEFSFGTRSELAKVSEGQFNEENAKARWDGDTSHVSLDGEKDAPLNGKYCRIFKSMLGEADGIVREFPDGTIPCSEIPGAG